MMLTHRYGALQKSPITTEGFEQCIVDYVTLCFGVGYVPPVTTVDEFATFLCAGNKRQTLCQCFLGVLQDILTDFHAHISSCSFSDGCVSTTDVTWGIQANNVTMSRVLLSWTKLMG
eukprot:PhF_6_TR13946/c0_g1_i3/m.22439